MAIATQITNCGYFNPIFFTVKDMQYSYRRLQLRPSIGVILASKWQTGFPPIASTHPLSVAGLDHCGVGM